MHHLQLTAFAALIAVSAALTGCADARPAPPVAAHARAPLTPVRAAPDARTFSGRVPRLGRADQPRDTLRLSRVLGDSLAFASITALEPVGSQLLVADRMMSKHVALVDLSHRRRAGPRRRAWRRSP